jgi:hypothetical protein
MVGLIDNVLFSFLYLIPVCSEGNIVDHISAKHKLTWCCLQCCMIGASNNIVTNDLSMSLTFLCTCSMIAFACGLMVVTCSLLGLNAIFVLHTHLFELTFEFASSTIVKHNIEVAGNVPSRTKCYETNPG